MGDKKCRVVRRTLDIDGLRVCRLMVLRDLQGAADTRAAICLQRRERVGSTWEGLTRVRRQETPTSDCRCRLCWLSLSEEFVRDGRSSFLAAYLGVILAARSPTRSDLTCTQRAKEGRPPEGAGCEEGAEQRSSELPGRTSAKRATRQHLSAQMLPLGAGCHATPSASVWWAPDPNGG